MPLLVGRRLRRLARRVRAGGERSRPRPDLFASLRAELVPLVAGIAGSKRPLRMSRRSAGDFPVDRQKGLRRDRRRVDRLRLRPWPARHHGAPVLQRDRPGRLPDHHAVRPTRLHRRLLLDPPRGRPRPLRARARPGAPWHPDGRGRLARRPRVAVEALGERRRPESGILVALAPAGPSGLPRPIADTTSTSSTPRSTGSPPP